MMGTTFLTSRQMILKTGWSSDPQQRMIQKLMLYGIPFSLLLSGWYFPIGVIIYWVTQNLFSLGQQYWVLHKYPPPVTAGNMPMKQARTAPAAKSNGKVADGKAAMARSRMARWRTARRPTLSGTKRAGGGFVNPIQEAAAKAGLFRRKRDAEPEPAPEPAVESRSTAPKVGAKPTNPKPTPRKAPPRKVVVAKAAPGKSTPSKKGGPKR